MKRFEGTQASFENHLLVQPSTHRYVCYLMDCKGNSSELLKGHPCCTCLPPEWEIDDSMM